MPDSSPTAGSVQFLRDSNEFVAAIAADLSRGQVVFPTSFDTTIRLRELLRSERTSVQDLVRVISADPLLSGRVVQAANSVAYARLGKRVSDIRSAVVRIGTNQVRTLATAVAMAQIVTYRTMAPFRAICQRIIAHCRQVAAYAFVLTRAQGRLDADKALFAGLIHDLGTLYLLFRLSEQPQLLGDAKGLRTLLIKWRGEIGYSVMAALAVTAEIQEAMYEFDHMEACAGAHSLADVLFIADTLTELNGPNTEPLRSYDAQARADAIQSVDDYAAIIAGATGEIHDLIRDVG
jgi:HD-like signal output (HDOD) protein